MMKLRVLIALFIISILTFSCKKDDISVEPLRDYAEQYALEKENIEKFLKDYTITVINNPGGNDDMDVAYLKITDPLTQVAIWDMPNLTFRDVTLHDIVYKVYYLNLREGVGSYPTNVDAVLTSYRGVRLYTQAIEGETEVTIENAQFEYNQFPSSMFRLDGVIRGWSEIFPQFKTGTYTEAADGSVSYTDFGAGVMFLPSGLGYYNITLSGIPAYSPLVFSFKLYELQRLDQDQDGIKSVFEDLNNDRYMFTLATGVVNADDTDGDGVPDYLDVDDDGDGILTKNEIDRDSSGVAILPYPDCDGDGIPNYLDPDVCP